MERTYNQRPLIPEVSKCWSMDEIENAMKLSPRCSPSRVCSNRIEPTAAFRGFANGLYPDFA
jgi:hypothetical protein